MSQNYKIPTKSVDLVQSRRHHHFIECNWFSLTMGWKIAHFGDKHQSLTHLDSGIKRNYNCISQHESVCMILVWKVFKYLPNYYRLSRVPRENITINGVFIPKGTDVSVPICGLHRNPKYWPDPEKFDPDRWDLESFYLIVSCIVFSD